MLLEHFLEPTHIDWRLTPELGIDLAREVAQSARHYVVGVETGNQLREEVLQVGLSGCNTRTSVDRNAACCPAPNRSGAESANGRPAGFASQNKSLAASQRPRTSVGPCGTCALTAAAPRTAHHYHPPQRTTPAVLQGTFQQLPDRVVTVSTNWLAEDPVGGPVPDLSQHTPLMGQLARALFRLSSAVEAVRQRVGVRRALNASCMLPARLQFSAPSVTVVRATTAPSNNVGEIATPDRPCAAGCHGPLLRCVAPAGHGRRASQCGRQARPALRGGAPAAGGPDRCANTHLDIPAAEARAAAIGVVYRVLSTITCISIMPTWC